MLRTTLSSRFVHLAVQIKGSTSPLKAVIDAEESSSDPVFCVADEIVAVALPSATAYFSAVLLPPAAFGFTVALAICAVEATGTGLGPLKMGCEVPRPSA